MSLHQHIRTQVDVIIQHVNLKVQYVVVGKNFKSEQKDLNFFYDLN